MSPGRPKEIRAVEVLIRCFWFASRKAVDEVGLLDERFFICSEDMGSCRCFWKADRKIFHNSNGKVIYIGSARSDNDLVVFSIETVRSD